MRNHAADMPVASMHTGMHAWAPTGLRYRDLHWGPELLSWTSTQPACLLCADRCELCLLMCVGTSLQQQLRLHVGKPDCAVSIRGILCVLCLGSLSTTIQLTVKHFCCAVKR